MRVLLFALMFVAANSVFGQVMGPRLEAVEDKYEFGDVVEGKVVNHDFVIYNAGDDILKIEKVRASCGCTAANPTKDALAPGDSAKITVSFNTARRVGPQRKHVYVFSNSVENPEFRMTFTANVVKSEQDEAMLKSAPQLKMDKRLHDFGTVAEGEVLGLAVKLTNTGKSDLQIKEVKTTCGCTAALLSSKELKPGEEGSLRIELDTSERSGKMARTVTIFSNDPREPEQHITLFVNIEKRES